MSKHSIFVMLTTPIHGNHGRSVRPRAPLRFATLVLGCMLSALAIPAPAFADLKICNMTASRIGVAIGYKDKKSWISEGWWNVASNACETLLKGDLDGRFYYIHAVDYDRGGHWDEKNGIASRLCTKDNKFTIRGKTECVKRGFNQEWFFEVDTGEEFDWTVRLTDTVPSGTKTQ